MRRAARFLAFGLAGVLLFAVLLVGAILLAANTGPGRRLIETEAQSLTGGMVRITGLSGRFPDAPRLSTLEIADSKGVWIRVDNLALHWSPLALLGRTAELDHVAIGHLALFRQPVPSGQAAKPAPAKASSGLPVAVDLRALDIERADLAAPVAGVAAALHLAGAAHIERTLTQGKGRIDITRLDAPGSYTVDLAADGTAITAHATVHEPAGGLIAALGKIPALGPIALTASLDGPTSGETLALDTTAGPLAARAHGTIDFEHRGAVLDAALTAPAMSPRPDVAWTGIDVAAHIAGPWAKPEAHGHVNIAGLKAGGAAVEKLVATIAGNPGQVTLDATLDGTRLPGPKPELFAAAPLRLTGEVHLDSPDRPVTFALDHPILSARGAAKTGGPLSADLETTIPDVAPLAAIGGVVLTGTTHATAHLASRNGEQTVTVDGKADFTGGQAPVPMLLGPTTFGATATLSGQDIRIERLSVDGAALHASVSGTDTDNRLALAWKVGLTDLSKAYPKAEGAVEAHGRIDGPQSGLTVSAALDGQAGGQGIAKGPVTLTLHAEDVPSQPHGTLTAEGRLGGSPLALAADLQREPDGMLRLLLRRADWKSLHAESALALAPKASLPDGTLSLRLGNLADFAAFVGQPLTGSVVAKFESSAAQHEARIDLRANGLAAQNNRIGAVTVIGTVRDPTSNPNVALAVNADAIAAGAVTGNLALRANGPKEALVLATTGAFQNIAGKATRFSATTRVDAVAKTALLQTLTADIGGETLRLAAPARVAFANGVAIDRLRLLAGAASLDVAGKLSPTLDATIALRNVTPDLAKPFAPDLRAAGTLAASARLTGAPSHPAGSLRLTLAGGRLLTGPASSLPPAILDLRATLDGSAAHLDSRFDAGAKVHLALAGTAPESAQGPLTLSTTGHLDLLALDPVLAAGGRRARGTLALQAQIGGTVAKPAGSGSATLTGGEIQDFAQGIHLTDIAGRFDLAGDTLRIARFDAHAGNGVMSASGMIGVLAPTLPVDLRLTAHNAKPLASDLLSAVLDLDLSVKGEGAGTLDAAGKVGIRHADINIAENLPPSVAVLKVRKAGEKPAPPPPPSTSVVRLDIAVDAPSEIFVRGHGLEAEMSGTLAVKGTAATPQISGGFQMRRGDFSLAGTTLTFTKGEVSFDGTSVTNRIDPTLNFVAESVQNGVDATLTIGGYASRPKITLSSLPDLPQDEVLAHLLFGTSMKNLTPLQIAQIGAALAEISGVTGGGGGPLDAVRKGLGLDRLNVGGGTNGAGASVEAGRYVAKGVYVGAKQSAGGAGGTQAEVQVDLTRHLKLTTTLGTGGAATQGATPENDPGSSVGIQYQFEY